MAGRRERLIAPPLPGWLAAETEARTTSTRNRVCSETATERPSPCDMPDVARASTQLRAAAPPSPA
eukprot:6345010-Prymnesium_polylepis.1